MGQRQMKTLRFIDYVYKILFDMGVTTTKKAELVAFQLIDLEQSDYY